MKLRSPALGHTADGFTYRHHVGRHYMGLLGAESEVATNIPRSFAL
jgi:hypothetical protein